MYRFRYVFSDFVELQTRNEFRNIIFKNTVITVEKKKSSVRLSLKKTLRFCTNNILNSEQSEGTIDFFLASESAAPTQYFINLWK